MTSQQNLKKLSASLFGIVITLLACWYVLHKIIYISSWVDPRWRSSEVWFSLLLMALTYAISGIILARAWLVILNTCAPQKLTWGEGWSIYAKTQIFKYLPFNIFHLVGRYALLWHRSLPHNIIISVTLVELISIGSVASLFSLILILPLLASFLSDYLTLPSYSLWIMLACLSSISIGGLIVCRYYKLWDFFLLRNIIRALALALPLHAIFFCATGFIAMVLLQIGADSRVILPLVKLIGIMAFAWLLGFIIPGSPGGMGVRELLIIYSLSSVVDLATATFVALSYRIVTVLGDIFFALFGYVYSTTRRKEIKI